MGMGMGRAWQMRRSSSSGIGIGIAYVNMDMSTLALTCVWLRVPWPPETLAGLMPRVVSRQAGLPLPCRCRCAIVTKPNRSRPATRQP
jgi:hypothetical protein